jgi:hypothetical protein
MQEVVGHLLLLQGGENENLYSTSVPEGTLEIVRIFLGISDKEIETEHKLTCFPHILWPKLFY